MFKLETMTIQVEVPVYIEYAYHSAEPENNSPEHIVVENIELPTKFGISDFLPDHERLVELAWEDRKEKQEGKNRMKLLTLKTEIGNIMHKYYEELPKEDKPSYNKFMYGPKSINQAFEDWEKEEKKRLGK